MKLYELEYGDRFTLVSDPTTTFTLDRGDGMYMWVSWTSIKKHNISDSTCYYAPAINTGKMYIGEEVEKVE